MRQRHEQIESLLRARENQDVFRLPAESTRDGVSQDRVAFRRAMSPHRWSRPASSTLSSDRRNASTGKRSSAGMPAASEMSRGSTESRTRSRITESVERSADAATFPRQANGAPEASGAADTNVPRPTNPRTRPRDFELPIRADDGGAADAKREGQLPLGRQPVAGRERALRDAALERVNDDVDRPADCAAGPPTVPAGAAAVTEEVGLCGRSIPGASWIASLFARASLLDEVPISWIGVEPIEPGFDAEIDDRRVVLAEARASSVKRLIAIADRGMRQRPSRADDVAPRARPLRAARVRPAARARVAVDGEAVGEPGQRNRIEVIAGQAASSFGGGFLARACVTQSRRQQPPRRDEASSMSSVWRQRSIALVIPGEVADPRGTRVDHQAQRIQIARAVGRRRGFLQCVRAPRGTTRNVGAPLRCWH